MKASTASSKQNCKVIPYERSLISFEQFTYGYFMTATSYGDPYGYRKGVRFFSVKHVHRRVGGCYTLETAVPKTWVLSNVWITPSSRGEGWGRVLLTEALRWADAEGVRLILESRPYGKSPALAMEALTRFYERLGFRWDEAWGLWARDATPQTVN